MMIRLINTHNVNKHDNYKLHQDGVCVIKNIISKNTIMEFKTKIEMDQTLDVKKEIMESTHIKNKIKDMLGPSYKFHDYVFLIKKSQVHTCHRDYNGDFFNEDQIYPSYTIIIYLENMEKCLDVIPKSHKSFYSHAINITDHTETVLCRAGDAILFNGNLIHTGTINEREDNMRIQMNVSHIDDHETLGFYQNYNKILNKNNTRPKWMKQMHKHITCQFPILGTYSQNYDFHLLTDKNEGDDKNTSITSPITTFFRSLYSSIVYGDAKFYDLQNI